jgi:HK97 family phage prohead protease
MSDFKYVDKQTLKDADDTSGLALRKQFSGVRKAIDMERRAVDFVVSTGAVDRDGDTIDPRGFQLEAYRQNPVVLFAHDISQPPVARAESIESDGQALRSQAVFASRETYPFADTIFRLLADGFLNAASVGFIPRQFSFSDDDERGLLAMDITQADLMEFSVVPVPSNPEALVQARSKGIDVDPLKTWAESVLDSDDGPRTEAQKLYELLSKSRSYMPSLTRQLDTLNENLKRVSQGGGPRIDVVIGKQQAEQEQQREDRMKRLRGMAQRAKRARILTP